MLALTFVFGLIVGSFLNAVIHRLHTGESIWETSSRCPRCAHRLSWIDLVPLVSFFMLRKRCRYCAKPISWQYPLVELATAAAFVLIYLSSVIPAKAGIQFWLPGSLQFGGQASPRMTEYVGMLFQFAFVSFLIIIFVYDLKHYLILDRVLIPATILAIFYQIWLGRFWVGIAGALILSGFFALQYIISSGSWIGAGDIKLGIFLGFLAPFPVVLVLLFAAYMLGAAVSVVLLALRKKKMTSKLPFGTFLSAAAFLAMLWGEGIIGWYSGLIGLN